MKSQTGKQTIAVYILPDISRSKDNQTIITFGQLIEYDMRNICLKNQAQNVAEKLILDSFLKNQN